MSEGDSSSSVSAVRELLARVEAMTIDQRCPSVRRAPAGISVPQPSPAHSGKLEEFQARSPSPVSGEPAERGECRLAFGSSSRRSACTNHGWLRDR